ncbi:carbamoyl-phosphate synthase (glutamine-hydrolyzing) large subunit [Aneurinibacillus sp. Ricciae_BoGa-3]|uniref:carbamoyl-phosphate synthase (glutamine-hydrolyzing) large subunit n=1 Tax=Aneurinibacillus sp. Ricciae_BoGa-3 TaxID=3022697 RepID=UPI0023410663|nr:carbamoyl-phosphate synthase (glutamine-hydrolyzing) large subunit [Aneurinibacillus sp. Ricciae_BoGa-3]WCK54161.1 carbamoyl-phosphate synthase (glutamine-hydrolyzing) large subunit [Aneurinibacillus sp. Ricciae_BoGa-3]
MPKKTEIKKVLVLGSGPIVIGQAAEFDYAGAQACLALREEGVEVILVNNNPATIMTDDEVADRIYMEPLTVESVEKIIARERPDGVLPTLGGQTGLNLAVALSDAGVLEKYNVELLGTPLDTIMKGEDREQFKQVMQEIGEPVAESETVQTVEDALVFASRIGYPVIVRPAYTLGGAGGGIADTEEELLAVAARGLQASPIQQILVERSVKGWKEIEYEVMRDANDTCIIVCNMENFDAVGIHTGDSIVFAPSQTLTDRQYQMLRSVSCKVIRALGVVGGCNIQFALDPNSEQYYLIEVNPRVSRSSALASKATGYPIARTAAKLALGYHLDEVINPITGYTYASFEPAIDYVVAKIPRWPFDKFPHADRALGTQMKATGEVMSIDRTLEGALLKGIRSLEIGVQHVELSYVKEADEAELEEALTAATDERIFYIAEALRRGMSVDDLYVKTQVDRYFLRALERIVAIENKLKDVRWAGVDRELLKEAKLRGFADSTIASLCGVSFEEVRARLKEWGMAPAFKLVDTCAAEFVAQTPYYFSTWQGADEVPVETADKKVLVLGSGPIRIGQGIEFDYCSVHAAKALRKHDVKAVVINNNPETVSTDYNTADQLYFEPLSLEDVLNVIEKEKVDGVMVQFGGQTAINLADKLLRAGVHVYGTSVDAIDRVEDRERFYEMLRKLEIPHIPGEGVNSQQGAHLVAEEIGYPVLIRPSYVIGGRGMAVLNNPEELDQYFADWNRYTSSGALFPLLIDKYVSGMEVEVDAVCDGEDVLIPGIFEHIERAGVHSGDSMAIFPTPNLSQQQCGEIARYTKLIAAEMQACGLINIQLVIDTEGTIYVLEVNPRASRTIPIVSKVTGIPMVPLATRVQLGEKLADIGCGTGLMPRIPFFAVKGPVFSTIKLNGVDPALGPEMKSTGEVIGLSYSVEEAVAKAIGWKEGICDWLEPEDAILISLSDPDKQAFIPYLPKLKELNLSILATPGTAAFLAQHDVPVKEIVETPEQVKELCTQMPVKAFVNTPTLGNKRGRLGFALRQLALSLNITCFTFLDTFASYLAVHGHKLGEAQDLGRYLLEEKRKEPVQ